MRCALCDDKDSLVIQVFGGHFLPLCIRNGHDCVSHSEAAARLAVENEKLKAMIEKMRCCGNCKHERASTYNPDYGCDGCLEGYTKWGLAT